MKCVANCTDLRGRSQQNLAQGEPIDPTLTVRKLRLATNPQTPATTAWSGPERIQAGTQPATSISRNIMGFTAN